MIASNRLPGIVATLAMMLAALEAVPGSSAEPQPAKVPAVDRSTLLDPTQVTPEMAAWLQARVPTELPPRQLLSRLLDVLESKELGLRYQAGHTGTAAEVFRTRVFNCLGFAHLLVGLARYMGVDAYYLLVPEVERYSRLGDVVLAAGHATAGFGNGAERLVLQYTIGPPLDYRRVVRIGDERALALTYSNLGAEALLAGDSRAAERRFGVAVSLDPDYAPHWSNLGVARRRRGNLAGAEEAYRQAISLDHSSLTAYLNLFGLLRMKGQGDAAQTLLQLLDRRDNRNPFAYLVLGDASRESGELRAAHRFYKRALHLEGGRSEARAALGLLALDQGRAAAARRWLRRAEKSGGDPGPRLEELVARLAAGSSTIVGGGGERVASKGN